MWQVYESSDSAVPELMTVGHKMMAYDLSVLTLDRVSLIK